MTQCEQMLDMLKANGSITGICYYYEYFEVFGLTDEEFNELKEYYVELREARNGRDT